MAPTCPHGLPPTQCLICPTLPQPVGVATGAPASQRHGRTATHVATAVIAVAVVGLAIWFVVGVVLSVLHIVELAVVALGAGWAGYRMGHFQGRRSRPGPPGPGSP